MVSYSSGMSSGRYFSDCDLKNKTKQKARQPLKCFPLFLPSVGDFRLRPATSDCLCHFCGPCGPQDCPICLHFTLYHFNLYFNSLLHSLTNLELCSAASGQSRSDLDAGLQDRGVLKGARQRAAGALLPTARTLPPPSSSGSWIWLRNCKASRWQSHGSPRVPHHTQHAAIWKHLEASRDGTSAYKFQFFFSSRQTPGAMPFLHPQTGAMRKELACGCVSPRIPNTSQVFNLSDCFQIPVIVIEYVKFQRY